MAIRFTSPETKDAIDNINKIVQIVALIVAAVWAFHVYKQTAEPGLDFRGTSDSLISWSEGPDKTNCLGSYTATIRNEGLRAFEVKAFTIRAWLYPTAQTSTASSQNSLVKPSFVDYEKIKDTDPFYSRTYDQPGELAGHYAPGINFYRTWDWSFARNPGQGVLFEITSQTDQGVSPSSSIADNVCPSSKLEKNDAKGTQTQ